MNSVNRVAIVVRPQPPFFAWAATLEGGLPASIDTLNSIYLVDAPESAPPARIVQRHFRAIFDHQLELWHLIVDDWPTPRTLARFQEWFQADISEEIYDLSDAPLDYD